MDVFVCPLKSEIGFLLTQLCVCVFVCVCLFFSSPVSKAHAPELKRFMDKRLGLKLNGSRRVQGILRGFDPFMNVVLDQAVEVGANNETKEIGMVVIRGNSIVMLEAMARI